MATPLKSSDELNFKLVVLDVMLPGIDGFEVLRRMQKAELRDDVILMTARGELRECAPNLGLGADDYLEKPFAMQELLARVNGFGRRDGKTAAAKLEVGDLSLDLTTNELRRGARKIELSARELRLLLVLMREPGRVFSRPELCERVWDRKQQADRQLVEVFIGRLRRKIDSPPLIRAVRHLGYTIAPSRWSANSTSLSKTLHRSGIEPETQ